MDTHHHLVLVYFTLELKYMAQVWNLLSFRQVLY